MRKAFQPVLLLGFCLVFLGGCTNQENAGPAVFDLTAAKKEVDANNRQFMDFFAKQDSAGIAGLYASDASFMNSGGPAVSGRAGIQSLMSGFMQAGLTRVNFSSKDIWGCGDMLVEEGGLQLFVKEQQVADEKYLVVWKKEDGKWKIFRDISNSNLPAPGAH